MEDFTTRAELYRHVERDSESDWLATLADGRSPSRVGCEVCDSVNATVTFIGTKRAILAQITHRSSSSVQEIYMIYSPLHVTIRKEVSRDEITDFDTLIDKNRYVEKVLQEEDDAKDKISTSHVGQPLAPITQWAVFSCIYSKF